MKDCPHLVEPIAPRPMRRRAPGAGSAESTANCFVYLGLFRAGALRDTSVQESSMRLVLSASSDVLGLVVRTSRSLAVSRAGRGSGGLQGETPNGLSASASLPKIP